MAGYKCPICRSRKYKNLDPTRVLLQCRDCGQVYSPDIPPRRPPPW